MIMYAILKKCKYIRPQSHQRIVKERVYLDTQEKNTGKKRVTGELLFRQGGGLLVNRERWV